MEATLGAGTRRHCVGGVTREENPLVYVEIAGLSEGGAAACPNN